MHQNYGYNRNVHQNMVFNPTTQKRYIYYINNNSMYIQYICNAIYDNHGRFPNIIINSEDKMIFDVNCNYELICPNTEHNMRRLVDKVNYIMLYNNTYTPRHYRFVIYVNEHLKYYYTNIFNEYWRANMIIIPLHN